MIQKMRVLPFLPSLVVLVLAGCGAGSGSVSGKVTYKDKPLPGGTVTFVSADKKVNTGIIGSDGTYTIPKVTAGPVKVSVYPPGAPADMPPGMKMDASKMGGPADAGAPVTKAEPVNLPQQYQDPEKSGLTYTVKPGKQQYNIDLK